MHIHLIKGVVSVGMIIGRNRIISFLIIRTLQINMDLSLVLMVIPLDLFAGIRETALNMLKLVITEFELSTKGKDLERNSFRKRFAELRNMMI